MFYVDDVIVRANCADNVIVITDHCDYGIMGFFAESDGGPRPDHRRDPRRPQPRRRRPQVGQPDLRADHQHGRDRGLRHLK